MANIHLYFDLNLSGHTVAAKAYARALGLLDHHVECIPVAGADWHQYHYHSRETNKGEISIQCFIPPQLQPLPGGSNIAVFYHEWTRVPPLWIKKLDAFDAVIVSSKYLEQVLRESGFCGKIIYCPIPLETDSRLIKSSWSNGKPFTFLSVGEWHFRKGFHLLLEAFRRAFGESQDYKLIIKTTPGVKFSPPANVEIIARRLNEEELGNLYISSDVYVCTSLAEGFGLPVAEAMLHKLPVISHNWSGMTEFCGDGRNIDVPFSIVPQLFCSNPDYYAPGQQCGMIDVEACAQAMKNICLWSEEKRSMMAEKAHSLISTNFSDISTSKMLETIVS